MVEVKRIRAPEIPFTRFVIALFTLLVLAGLYYVVGGPVPYFIAWEGPVGATFEGRYTVFSDAGPDGEEGTQFSATYPHTVTIWASRRQGVVVSAENRDTTNALNSITVRRTGVVCTEVHLWSTTVDAVCSVP